MAKVYKKVKKRMWVLTIKSTSLIVPNHGKWVFSHRQDAIQYLESHGGSFWLGNEGKTKFKLAHKKVKVFKEIRKDGNKNEN